MKTQSNSSFSIFFSGNFTAPLCNVSQKEFWREDEEKDGCAIITPCQKSLYRAQTQTHTNPREMDEAEVKIQVMKLKLYIGYAIT